MDSWLSVSLLFSAVSAARYCDYPTQPINIDWERLPAGPWRWISATPDTYQRFFMCSKVTLYGKRDLSATIQMRYGPLFHQVYTLTGEYRDSAEYEIGDLEESWKNIVRFSVPEADSSKILAKLVNSRRKNRAVFFTDYKRYFISAVCLPNGRMSVAAFTSKRFAPPFLLARVRAVLKKNNILSEAFPFKVRCKKSRDGTKRDRRLQQYI